MTHYTNFQERLKAQAEAAQQQIFDRVGDKFKEQRREIFRPSDYQKPAYNTPEYYRDWNLGLISDEEARQDSTSYELRRKRAKDFYNEKALAPHRHSRPPPVESRQWCRPMATTAARDDRLTPQAKALLQVITARVGKGRVTDTTKTTLADIMNRCPRSIQRYIAELIKFDYIRTQWQKSRKTGFYIGLRIWIMNRALPYFTNDAKNRYDAGNYARNWLEMAGNSEETELSLTNINIKLSNIFSQKEPTWFKKLAYG